jgi:hypothetical protein
MRSCAFAIGVFLLALPAAALADTFTGTLNVIWGDPKDRASAGDIRYILATPDGRYVEMQVTGGANAVLPLSGNGRRNRAARVETGIGPHGGAKPSSSFRSRWSGAAPAARPRRTTPTGSRGAGCLPAIGFADDVSEGRLIRIRRASTLP